MKKRRTLIVSLLLIAALALGIGYATLSRDLKIDGVAKTTADSLKVVFHTASIDTVNSSANAATASEAGTPGDFTIGLTAAGLSTKGQKLVVEYTVINNNGYDVKVSAPRTSEDPANFTVEGVLVEGGTGTFNEGVYTLKTGETAKMTVTVTLDTDTADNLTEEFEVSVPVESAS